MERYSHDEAEWAPYDVPLAVARPTDAGQARTIVQWCVRHGVPVVPRGAGTGLSGGANAVAGSIVVSFERMTAVLRIDPVERLAVVQPGVVNDDLRAACAEHGLWYPPDPASSPWSTIGGNVATNAGGVCCVKYGVTGDYVLALEVVTGTGELVRVGRETAKGVAGYDLVSLLVGSEGTLGLVTEITVRLRPARPPEQTVVGFFDSLVAAGEAVAAVARAGTVPSALELLDRHCLTAVNDWKNLGIEADCEAILLARVDGPGAAGVAEAEAVLAAFEGAGATFAARSEDDAEADAMFAARRLAYSALERLGPVLTEDVCVPVGRVPEMLARGAGHRRAARRADRQHRPRRRRQPPPADHHPGRGRRGAGCGPRPRSTTSSPRRWPAAAPSPASTASACSSAPGSPPSCPSLSWTCTAPSGARSTRTGCSTPGRSSPDPSPPPHA